MEKKPASSSLNLFKRLRRLRGSTAAQTELCVDQFNIDLKSGISLADLRDSAEIVMYARGGPSRLYIEKGKAILFENGSIVCSSNGNILALSATMIRGIRKHGQIVWPFIDKLDPRA